MWKLDVLGTRYIQSVCMGHIVKTNCKTTTEQKRLITQRQFYK